jgi:hypothetical protein
MAKGVEHFFTYLLGIYTSVFEKCLFYSFPHLLTGLFVIWVFSFYEFFIYSEY